MIWCRFFFLFQKTFKIQSKSFWTQSAQHPLWSSLLLPICMYTSCITSALQLGQPSIIERGEVNQVWEIIEYLHLPLLTIDSLCTRIIWQYWQGRAQPPAPRNTPKKYSKNIQECPRNTNQMYGILGKTRKMPRTVDLMLSSRII